MQIESVNQANSLNVDNLSFVPFGVKPLPYPKESGVYFLRDGNTIVYIGQAINIYKRLIGHERRHQFIKLNCCISWVIVSPKNLDIVEATMIERFKPNINFSPNGKTNSNWELDSLLNDKGWSDESIYEHRERLALAEYKFNLESFNNGNHPALEFLS